MVGDDDYIKYRGQCRPMSEAAVAADPTLKLVRGYYHCPIWGNKHAHWWTKRPDGTIFDPTKDQFPSKGMGTYEEFDGYFNCSECGKRMKEGEEHDIIGNYIYCSNRCYGVHVGILDPETGELIDTRPF